MMHTGTFPGFTCALLVDLFCSRCLEIPPCHIYTVHAVFISLDQRMIIIIPKDTFEFCINRLGHISAYHNSLNVKLQ